MRLTMRLKGLTLVVLLGLTGCAQPIPCDVVAPRVADLRTALMQHPETPTLVGETGTDLVVGLEAICR